MGKDPDPDINDVSLWVALRAPAALEELLGEAVVDARAASTDEPPENVIPMYTFRAKLNYEVPAAVADEAIGRTTPAKHRRAN